MLKRIAVPALLGFALVTALPWYARAEDTRIVTGRVTAASATAISVYDKEIITIPLDDQTTITAWVREKPFARKTSYLARSAIKVGSLVMVKLREDRSAADVVQVAKDVQHTFKGRVVAFSDRSLSVYDKHMAVVTLRISERTSFTKLFTVKPWVRKPVHLAPADLKLGSFVKMFPSKIDASMANRVEIATDEPLLVPAYPLPKTGN